MSCLQEGMNYACITLKGASLMFSTLNKVPFWEPK